MKLTTSHLRKMIKEEMQKMQLGMNEVHNLDQSYIITGSEVSPKGIMIRAKHAQDMEFGGPEVEVVLPTSINDPDELHKALERKLAGEVDRDHFEQEIVSKHRIFQL